MRQPRLPRANVVAANENQELGQPSLDHACVVPVRDCVFCGGRPLTREHVFGRWLREQHGETVAVATSLTTAGKTKIGKPEVPFDLTAKVVCQECNNGWMSSLEEAFKSRHVTMLHGVPSELDGKSQTEIASWFYKTFLMLEKRALAADWLVPDEALRNFKNELTPPASVWIGLAYRRESFSSGETSVLAAIDRVRQLDKSGVEIAARGDLYGATLAIGSVVCLILGTVDGSAPPSLEVNEEIVIPIWPVVDARTWPPPTPVDDIGGVARLHEMIFSTAP